MTSDNGKKKLLILNGNRLCGKGVLSRYIKFTLPNLRWSQPELPYWYVTDAQCKENLHRLTQTLLGLNDTDYWDTYNSHEKKAECRFEVALSEDEYYWLRELVGNRGYRYVYSKTQEHYMTMLSLTDVMIYVSEILVKPRFGQDYFGRTRVDNLLQEARGVEDLGYNILAIDDSGGFEEELIPLERLVTLGWDIMILQIHGRGTFEGDSRGYVTGGGKYKLEVVHNTTTEQEYLDKAFTIVNNWLNT